MAKNSIDFGTERPAAFYIVNIIVTGLLGIAAARVLLEDKFNLIVVAFIIWLLILPVATLNFKTRVSLEGDELLVPEPFRFGTTRIVAVKTAQIEKVKESKRKFWTIKSGYQYQIQTKDLQSYTLKQFNAQDAISLSETLGVPFERHDLTPEIPS